MNIDSSEANKFWKFCLKYIEEKTDLDEALKLASDDTNPQLKTITSIYKRMLMSLINRQGMHNSIGDINDFKNILCKFNPSTVLKTYGSDWEKLFKEIKRDIRPKSRMKITVPQNYWVVFCKGVIDGAKFLSEFKSGQDFVDSINNLITHEAFIPSAPMLISLEIRGLGFALACDFLKESGWSQYAKPDTHTKYILKKCGYSSGSDYDVFKCMREIAKNTSETPYRIDKIIWLIGSGKLYNTSTTFKANRDEFIRNYNLYKNG